MRIRALPPILRWAWVWVCTRGHACVAKHQIWTQSVSQKDICVGLTFVFASWLLTGSLSNCSYSHEWTLLLAMKFHYREVVTAKLLSCLGGWFTGKKALLRCLLCLSLLYSFSQQFLPSTLPAPGPVPDARETETNDTASTPKDLRDLWS